MSAKKRQLSNNTEEFVDGHTSEEIISLQRQLIEAQNQIIELKTALEKVEKTKEIAKQIKKAWTKIRDFLAGFSTYDAAQARSQIDKCENGTSWVDVSHYAVEYCETLESAEHLNVFDNANAITDLINRM